MRYDYQKGAVERINELTTPEDEVLLWGAETTYNFLTLQKSPTAFVYQYPLYECRYASKEMVSKFLEGVINSKPKLIINSKNPGTPFLLPCYYDDPEIQGLLLEITNLYQPLYEKDGWDYFLLKQ